MIPYFEFYEPSRLKHWGFTALQDYLKIAKIMLYFLV